MAINYNAMADFDPMGAMAEYKFKADKAAREKADWELAHKAKQQAWSDNQNLRALAEQLQKGKEVPTEVQTGEMANMGPPVPPQSLRDMAPTMQTQGTAKDFGGGSPLKFAQTVANPEYAAAMKSYGDTVKSAPATLPIMETQMKNVPYSTGEKSQKFAEQLLRQGDITGALKATESILKLDEAMPKHMVDIHKLVNQEAMSELSANTPPDQVGKKIAAKYRMAGNEAAASLAENSKFLPNGVMVTPAPGGSVMTKYSADGGYSIDYHVAKAPTTEKVYGNPREVMFGGERVKEHPIFEGPSAAANKEAWVKAGSNFDKLGDFNGYAKKDNENSPRISVSMGNGPQEVESLAQMVADGELAPAQLPKRGGLYDKVVARAKVLNPSLNPRTADANFSLAKNPTFRQRSITAETLPEVFNSMVDAGKRVGFSDIKGAGKVQAFIKSQTNDPAFTEYMALRNDSLMEIASVMRQAGATDKATEMEAEAASPTMSPQALDAWMKAQMKALGPRLKNMRSAITPGRQGGLKGKVVNGYEFTGNTEAEWKDKSKWRKL